MARVRVFTGSHLSDRRTRIDDVLREYWNRAVLLLPTQRLVHRRRDLFVTETGLPGVLGAPFKTFDQLAAAILQGEGICAESLSDFQRTLLAQEVIAKLRDEGKLGRHGDACSTPGFATHALRIITQLKQAGVDHLRFAEVTKERAGASPFDAIVSEVYTRYQSAVIESGTYDRVGIIWQAETVARERKPAALKNCDALLLDCFDDFTLSELRLIDALRAHVSEIVFGFTFNITDPSQEDLYALPRTTANDVCQRFEVEYPESSEESDPQTFAAHAAQTIFWRSQPANAPEQRNVTLTEYRDAWHEIQATGRTVKSLLLGGTDPIQIAVLHRDISDAAFALRSTFTEFGIPIALTADSSLRGSSIAGFIVELLEATDAWERDRIAALLTSRWFGAEHEDNTDANSTFTLARAAGIIGGYRDWSRGLEALENRLKKAEVPRHLQDRIDDPARRCAQVSTAVARLKQLADSFPARAEEMRYVEATIALLDALNLVQTVAELPEPIASAEAPAIECLYDALKRWQAWSNRNAVGAPIRRAEFISRLRRALRDTPLPSARSANGVWCASMDEARHLEFDNVFLLGMNEGTVPRPAPVNAIYSQYDLESFQQHSIRLDSHQRHTEREMLLLHRCMSAAKQRLFISWHAMDPAGKQRTPSAFIEDVKSVVPGGLEVVSGGDPYPPLERAASRRDLVCASRSSGCDAALDADYSTRINDGAKIESARYRGSPFDNYDGIVSNEYTKRALAQRFGSSHTFSVNQFETYASCPFRFYMDRILAIPEDLAPDAAIDGRERGELLHRVLRLLHERFQGKHLAEVHANEWIPALDQSIDEVFEPFLRLGGAQVRALWSVERIRAQKRLKRFLNDTIEKDDPAWKPDLFEVAFGRVKPDADTGAERLTSFELHTEAGPIKFSGKIDRIDRAEDVVRIVDYKTSLHGLTQKKTETSDSLQLPIYGMVWNEQQPEAQCAEASFVQIGKWKKFNAFSVKKGAWTQLAEDVRKRVGELVVDMRDGRFPPDAEKGGCIACKARRACRYEQSRIERKRAASE